MKSLPKSDAIGLLIVASISALMVGPSIILVAYFIDFQRGYSIRHHDGPGCLPDGLPKPSDLPDHHRHPDRPAACAVVRFLQKYPLRREEASHE